MKGGEGQFEKKSFSEVNNYGISYDYGSLMHYSRNVWEKLCKRAFLHQFLGVCQRSSTEYYRTSRSVISSNNRNPTWAFIFGLQTPQFGYVLRFSSQLRPFIRYVFVWIQEYAPILCHVNILDIPIQTTVEYANARVRFYDSAKTWEFASEGLGGVYCDQLKPSSKCFWFPIFYLWCKFPDCGREIVATGEWQELRYSGAQDCYWRIRHVRSKWDVS